VVLLTQKIVDDSLPVDKLLRHETGGSKHGNTSVLELLGLHDEHLFGVIGLQAKRIETKVTGVVFLAKKTWLGNGDILGLNKTGLGALDLGGTNGDGQDTPKDGGDLGQVRDGGPTDLGIEEERRSLDLFTDKESDNCEHGNTPVSQFGLTISLHGTLIGLLGESERIKETDGGKGTGKVLGGKGVDGGSLVGGLGRREGGGRADKSDEGGGGLHCVVVVCHLVGQKYVYACTSLFVCNSSGVGSDAEEDDCSKKVGWIFYEAHSRSRFNLKPILL
jgi:hypothetical protein